MAIYSEAPNQVLSIAQEVIDSWHPHLKEARIGFIFRDEAAKSKGKTVFATARKPPGWLIVFEDYDFIIEIAEDIWKDLTSKRRLALIDHELCHCIYDDGKAGIMGHDFEEFTQIIERHGLWNYDLLTAGPKFMEATQLELPTIETKDGKVSAISPEIMDSAKKLKDDFGAEFVVEE